MRWDSQLRANSGDSWCICMWAFARMIEHDSNARPDKKKKRRSVVMTSDTGNVARHDVVMRGSSFDLDQAFPARPSAIDMVRPGANSELV